MKVVVINCLVLQRADVQAVVKKVEGKSLQWHIDEYAICEGLAKTRERLTAQEFELRDLQQEGNADGK